MVSDDVKKYLQLCKERKAVFERTRDERAAIDGRREEIGQRLLDEKIRTQPNRVDFMNEVRSLTNLLDDGRISSELSGKLIAILRPVFKNCRSSTTKVMVDSDKVRLVQPCGFSQGYDFECPDIVMGTFGLGLRRNKQSRAIDGVNYFTYVVAHLPLVVAALRKKYPQLASSLDDVVPDVEWFGKMSKYRGVIVRFDQPIWFTDEGGTDRLASAVAVDRNSIYVFSYVKEDGAYKYAVSSAYPNSVHSYVTFEQIDKDQVIIGMREMKKWFTKDSEGKTDAHFAVERVKEKLKRWLVMNAL